MTNNPHFLPSSLLLPNGPQRVVLLAFDDAQVLDVAGPAAVFAAANDELASPAYDVAVASPSGGTIRTTSCVVLATEPLAAIPP